MHLRSEFYALLLRDAGARPVGAVDFGRARNTTPRVNAEGDSCFPETLAFLPHPRLAYNLINQHHCRKIYR